MLWHSVVVRPIVIITQQRADLLSKTCLMLNFEAIKWLFWIAFMAAFIISVPRLMPVGSAFISMTVHLNS